MAEKRTRYNELLGIPNGIRDPDLYQLLGLDRAAFRAAEVEGAFKARMTKLQSIKSPKHKSFLEFLKGELRRAKSTLTNQGKRAAYDGELLEERRDQLSRILDVVLADGTLSPAEEDRIRDVARDVGLLDHETTKILSQELETRGARRDSGPDEAVKLTKPTGRAPRPSPKARAASDSEILNAITRRGLGSQSKSKPPPARRPRPSEAGRPIQAELVRPGKPPSQKTPPPIVAEYVGPPRRPEGEWEQVAKPARSTGWGKSSVVREVGVCTACLQPVEESTLKRGKAERLPDGRLHCAACTNQLIAGLICASCYQRITRQDMKGGRVSVEKSRVRHKRCT